MKLFKSPRLSEFSFIIDSRDGVLEMAINFNWIYHCKLLGPGIFFLFLLFDYFSLWTLERLKVTNKRLSIVNIFSECYTWPNS